jgi:hypothetical protein
MNRSTQSVVLAVLLAAGCRSEKPSGAPPAATEASAPATPTTVAGPLLLARFDDRNGIAFAESRGGTIEATAADGKPISIADGTSVEVTAVKDADLDSTYPATADVVVAGRAVTVPATGCRSRGH